MEMYLEGVSTRNVAEITEALCGTNFSKCQVAVWSRNLMPSWTRGESSPLTAAAYPYLVVDARYEHARVDGQVVSQGVLVVSGMRATGGTREILAVEVADTESEATYHDLFRAPQDRGLRASSW